VFTWSEIVILAWGRLAWNLRKF